jgi:hypothetical protein
VDAAVPAGVTVSQSPAVCAIPLGLAPITLNGYVPVLAVLSTKMVTVDELVRSAVVAIWSGPLLLKDALMSEGPEYVRDTL